MICANCGFKNRSGALVCEQCEVDLYEAHLMRVATRNLPRHTTKELQGRSKLPLLLYVDVAEKALPLERYASYLLGRSSDASDVPMGVILVDLNEFNGEEGGVSRAHARLDAQGPVPRLSDLGSANGTFVNGQRLTPNQPFELRSGDELRLGRFFLRVLFK